MTIDCFHLAEALAKLDAVGGFSKLSYQEQAEFIAKEIPEPKAALLKRSVIVAYSTDGTLSVLGPYKSDQVRDRVIRTMEASGDWQELHPARTAL